MQFCSHTTQQNDSKRCSVAVTIAWPMLPRNACWFQAPSVASASLRRSAWSNVNWEVLIGPHARPTHNQQCPKCASPYFQLWRPPSRAQVDRLLQQIILLPASTWLGPAPQKHGHAYPPRSALFLLGLTACRRQGEVLTHQ